MNQLKTYRITLISALAITGVLAVYCLVLSIINMIGITIEKVEDGLMYVICSLLLLAFVGMQIFNTCYSFKTGSNFIKNLVYNDDNKVNRRNWIVFIVFAGIAFVLLVYFLLVYFGLIDALQSLNQIMFTIIITFILVVFVDMSAISTFPIFGKEDESLKIKRRR